MGLPLALPDLDFTDAISQAQQFNPGALGQIFDHYYPQIYQYAIFRLGNEQAARGVSDQVFEQFIEALKKRRKTIDELSVWFFETARQIVDDQLDQSLHNQNQMQDSVTDQAANDHKPPDDEIVWLRHLVSKSLRLLIPEQQHLLALRFGGFWSTDETARMMGINVNHVKTIQFEALLSLRRLLEQEA